MPQNLDPSRLRENGSSGSQPRRHSRNTITRSDRNVGSDTSNRAMFNPTSSQVYQPILNSFREQLNMPPSFSTFQQPNLNAPASDEYMMNLMWNNHSAHSEGQGSHNERDPKATPEDDAMRSLENRRTVISYHDSPHGQSENNAAPSAPPLTQPPGARKFIVPGDFTINSRVQETVRLINQKVFTGESAEFKKLSSETLQKYKDHLEHEFCWSPDNNTKIWKKYFELVKKSYKNRLWGIRKDVINNNLKDFEPERDFLRLVPFCPPCISGPNWEKLCHAWNSDKWKRKSEAGKVNKRGKLLPGEEPFKHSLGSKTKDQAWKELEEKLGRSLHWPEFVEYYTTSRSGNKFHGRYERILHEYRAQLRERHGEEPEQHPSFDKAAWDIATGGSHKGIWFGVPLQLSHPDYFSTQSQCEEKERLRKENARLKRRLRQKDAKQARTQEENLSRMFNSAMSSIYGSLVTRGLLNLSDVPPSLVASSSTQGAFQHFTPNFTSTQAPLSAQQLLAQQNPRFPMHLPTHMTLPLFSDQNQVIPSTNDANGDNDDGSESIDDEDEMDEDDGSNI